MTMKQKTATVLMEQFAKRTGLLTAAEQASPRSQRAPAQTRYLWTDAFAVCNFLGLARHFASSGDDSGRRKYEHLAYVLVDSVHDILGRHRADDPDQNRRLKWLSGLPDEEARQHPTLGGLRIGKRDPERRADEAYDSSEEWDRDGQYFHYITKWMGALDQMARYSGEAKFNTWARELGSKAVSSFTYATRFGIDRMYWKMSTDLTRPQVLSMGAQDPLDGYVTLKRLLPTQDTLFPTGEADKLEAKQVERDMKCLEPMIDISPTTDPLGIGGMLTDAYFMWNVAGMEINLQSSLIEQLLQCSLIGLKAYSHSRDLDQSADFRLAFRELGLCIGIQAIGLICHKQLDVPTKDVESKIRAYFQKVVEFEPMVQKIQTFWLDPKNQRSRRWTEHIDINEVMLATSLAPEGFLSIG